MNTETNILPDRRRMRLPCAAPILLLVASVFCSNVAAIDFAAENARFKSIMEGFIAEIDEFSAPLDNCLAGMKTLKTDEIDPRIKQCKQLDEPTHIEAVVDLSNRLKAPIPEYSELLNAADAEGKSDALSTSYTAYEELVERFKKFMAEFNELKSLTESAAPASATVNTE